jgi:hypothetical protein
VRRFVFGAVAAFAALGTVGCGLAPLKVTTVPGEVPATVDFPGRSGKSTPGAMCLFGWSDKTIYGMTGILEKSGYRFLTKDNLDAKGCEVLVRGRMAGAWPISFIDVFAPYGGERIMQVEAEAGWGPVFGFERAGWYIQSQLKPGTALRKTLDEAKASKSLLSPEEIASMAGASALTWDELISWESDADKRAALIAKRDEAAKAATADDVEEPADAKAPAAPAVAAVTAHSDIDDLPASVAKDPHSHAVVIGVESYREKLPSAEFAAGDAKLAAKYFERALGVPEANIALLTEDHATKGDFEKYFERWLPNRVEAGDTVYVYFSGHGAPNPSKGDSYLVPYDGDPTYIDQTGFAVKRLLDDLAKLPAKQVYVAMDSCFSGAGGRSVIAKGARPLVTVTQAEVPSKVTVLSASAGDQISNSYEAKGHGLFTYYLLKGLKEKGGDLRVAFDYSKPEVARTARREFNADQDPQWRQGR